MKDPFKLNVKSIMALYELFPTEEACIKHLDKNPITSCAYNEKVKDEVTRFMIK